MGLKGKSRISTIVGNAILVLASSKHKEVTGKEQVPVTTWQSSTADALRPTGLGVKHGSAGGVLWSSAHLHGAPALKLAPGARTSSSSTW